MLRNLPMIMVELSNSKDNNVMYINNELSSMKTPNIFFQPKFEYSSDELCGSEPFVYKHKVVNSSGTFIISGQKFDCELGMPYLEMFSLTKNHPITPRPVDPNNIVFVIAADLNFYPSARVVINEIRKHFGNQLKIIYYDLGGTINNPRTKEEMLGICNFEARAFKWDLLPKLVTDKKIFTWKILITAEMFNEVDTFIYMDSSIFLETGDFTAFWDMINNKTLTPFQMSGATGHSIRHATHKGMYKYISLDMTIDRYHDMLEANMMFFHKDEVTKEIIKWALLCGITRPCIEPPGAVLGCVREESTVTEGQCHRQDQSVFNILLANYEQKLLNEGVNILSHVNPSHPKNTRQRHQTRRMQETQEKIDHCKHL